MARRKVNQRKGVINEELLQRIDKMNDNKEFDPYASIKRTTILQEELFNKDDYEHKNGASNDSTSIMVPK